MKKSLGLVNFALSFVFLVVALIGCGTETDPVATGGTGGGGTTGCGDGVVDGSADPYETCDDGNAVSGDGCSNNCRIEFVVWDGEVSMTGTAALTELSTGEAVVEPVECTGRLVVAAEGPTSELREGSMSCRLNLLGSGSDWSFQNGTRTGDDLTDLNITFNAEFFPCQGEGLDLFGELTYERDADGGLTASTMTGTFMKACTRVEGGTRTEVALTGTFEATTTRIGEFD